MPKDMAVIHGVSGQDGAYLANRLIKNGYRVIGLSRNVAAGNFSGLVRLEIKDSLQLKALDVGDFNQVLALIEKFRPAEIYDLAGQSSVAESFKAPETTRQSIVGSTAQWLEAVLRSGRDIKFFNPSSSECFGNTASPANENSPFAPLSPYAEAKCQSHFLVREYRHQYGIQACSGILFNHESPLRPTRFVSQKIIQAAYRISQGSKEKLFLGNLNVSRDWGWAPDYVEAIHLLLQQSQVDDYVIATGQTFSIQDFLEYVFSSYGLDWSAHVVSDPSFIRPQDISMSQADPQKIKNQLGWSAKRNMYGVVDGMIKSLS